MPYPPAMAKPDQIHKGKQPNRPHFIPEWARRRGFKKQTALAKELNADKSVVSRWYKGTSPTEEYQEKLAALFHCETESLFRHPDEDWFVRFFRGRADEEIERMKQSLELTFPLKSKKAS